ncbi:MAG: HdeD family acid-resistance protein [Dysgonomonas mossii]|uniref:HdeD family acid-resistance protein n=1 Tax=Dysgonomonas mossii TaxID=163665 RepID=UPI0026EF7A0A|nr:HdeD family acid-resistance protein [Dysgonomonas mossii]MBS5907634.1 HdeD family acid-resistance protein [Dysgonomonas mossii]
MRNDLFYSVKQAVKYWWVSLLIGLLAIMLGVWCLTSPWTTITALSIVFSVTFFVSGVFEIIFAVSNRNTLKGWGWTLVSGIIDLLFGIILISMSPAVIAIVLSYFVGFWVMFQSIWGIGAAVELQRNGAKGWGWLLTLAVLGVILSFIFIMSPVLTSGFIVALISISFISYGFFRIYLGMRLKSLHKEMENIEKEIHNE